MLRLIKTVFIMSFMWYCISHSAALRIGFTRQPLLGYRCVREDTSNQTTLFNTARAQCVWRCLSGNCVVISYNHRINSCELSMQLCDTVVPAADISINIYSLHRKLCSVWVPKSKFDGQKAIICPQNPEIPSEKTAVARKEVDSAKFPGKHQLFSGFNIIIAVDHNRIVKDDIGEVLLVNSACLFEWIPYSSLDKLPVGAFVGGYDANKEPLYVARAVFEGIYSIDYYKSSKSLAYFMIYGEARTSKTMDILVNLWHLHKTLCQNSIPKTIQSVAIRTTEPIIAIPSPLISFVFSPNIRGTFCQQIIGKNEMKLQYYKRNKEKDLIIAPSTYYKDGFDNPLTLWYGWVITSYVQQEVLIFIPELISVNLSEHNGPKQIFIPFHFPTEGLWLIVLLLPFADKSDMRCFWLNFVPWYYFIYSATDPVCSVNTVPYCCCPFLYLRMCLSTVTERVPLAQAGPEFALVPGNFLGPSAGMGLARFMKLRLIGI